MHRFDIGYHYFACMDQRQPQVAMETRTIRIGPPVRRSGRRRANNGDHDVPASIPSNSRSSKYQNYCIAGASAPPAGAGAITSTSSHHNHTTRSTRSDAVVRIERNELQWKKNKNTPTTTEVSSPPMTMTKMTTTISTAQNRDKDDDTTIDDDNTTVVLANLDDKPLSIIDVRRASSNSIFVSGTSPKSRTAGTTIVQQQHQQEQRSPCSTPRKTSTGTERRISQLQKAGLLISSSSVSSHPSRSLPPLPLASSSSCFAKKRTGAVAWKRDKGRDKDTKTTTQYSLVAPWVLQQQEKQQPMSNSIPMPIPTPPQVTNANYSINDNINTSVNIKVNMNDDVDPVIGARPNYRGQRVSQKEYPDPETFLWTFTGGCEERQVENFEKEFGHCYCYHNYYRHHGHHYCSGGRDDHLSSPLRCSCFCLVQLDFYYATGSFQTQTTTLEQQQQYHLIEKTTGTTTSTSTSTSTTTTHTSLLVCSGAKNLNVGTDTAAGRLASKLSSSSLLLSSPRMYWQILTNPLEFEYNTQQQQQQQQQQ